MGPLGVGGGGLPVGADIRAPHLQQNPLLTGFVCPQAGHELSNPEPQELQNRASSGLSCSQLGQIIASLPPPSLGTRRLTRETAASVSLN